MLFTLGIIVGMLVGIVVCYLGVNEQMKSSGVFEVEAYKDDKVVFKKTFKNEYLLVKAGNFYDKVVITKGG
jgi:hypothetical protein